MNAETTQISAAQGLCRLLSISFANRESQDEKFSELVDVYETVVLIFRDEDETLFAFSLKVILRGYQM